MFSEGNKEVIIKHSRKYLKLFECGKLAFGRKSLKHILCKAVIQSLSWTSELQSNNLYLKYRDM